MFVDGQVVLLISNISALSSALRKGLATGDFYLRLWPSKVTQLESSFKTGEGGGVRKCAYVIGLYLSWVNWRTDR